MFKVRDPGPGIAPELRRRLFREVQPGNGGGAGIGLRIAHRASEAQGGEIGISSEGEHGAEFWIRLPRAARSRDPSSAREGPAATH